jgi:hypothetical protein
MGCTQSTIKKEEAVTVENEDEPKKMSAVGATERLVSRAHRIQAKMNSTNGVSSEVKAPPKLDECGNLMIEEIVRRTNSSIFTETMTLGTQEYPIHVKVRASQID